MSERLHIITPMSRPWHLSRIAWNYFGEMEPHPWEIRWYVFGQGPEPDFKGQNKNNEAINQIKDGWLYMWSDDATQHPSLFRRLSEVVSGHPDAGAIVFSEERPGHILHASKDTVKPCHICGSMICYKREFLGDNRYDTPAHGDQADGHLAEKLYNEHPEKWVFVDEILLKFNSLP